MRRDAGVGDRHGVLKADNTVGVGLTLVFSSAVSLHVDGTIIPGAGFSGSWSDSVGRAGTLLFTSWGGYRRTASPRGGTRWSRTGSSVAQPPGGTDRGLSATVTTDSGAPNDAAGLYGRFGAPLPPGLEGPAGVRGESAASAGVFGRSDSAIGVVGGANGGIGVQGHAVAASGVGIQAHHVNGGTALEINNGTIRGRHRPVCVHRHCFRDQTNARGIDLPILRGNPNALVFVTPKRFGYTVSAGYDTTFTPQWIICVAATGASTGRTRVRCW